MDTSLTAVKEAAAFIRDRMNASPRVGVIMGTGLNALAGEMDIETALPYGDIPHWPHTTVSFHKGRLLLGAIAGVPSVVMQGRFHYYEGYSMQQITFPVRVMQALGIKTLLLSNAAGGMNPAYKKGDLVIIDDHINLLPDNPLRGLSDEWGNRFVDMSRPYSQKLALGLQEAFTSAGVAYKTGIYVSVMGPNLETRAEYRWLRNTGADMVGMSTVPEVIVANQCGMQCAAVSVITDECDPDNLQTVNIAEIIEVAGQADEKLVQVWKHLIMALASKA